MELKERFLQNCLLFTKDQNLIENLWSEIEQKYSEKGRYYHNLEHIKNMFSELDSVKDKLENYSLVLFSVFYHDVIYDASSKSNEEKSAEFAKIRLEKLHVDSHSVKKISEQIIATKTHQKSEDNDTNYLLDADLSILGKDLETYIDYTKKIRKEYAIYPDIFYKPGRKKFYSIFLNRKTFLKLNIFTKNMKSGQERIFCLRLRIYNWVMFWLKPHYC
ncbi:HD domain-containing protein [Chryseobacterium wanjuense]